MKIQFDKVPSKEKMIAAFENEIAYAKEVIEKFKKEQEKSMSNALSWSESAFKAVATVDILGRYVKYLKEDKEATVERVFESAMNSLLTQTRLGGSTSSTENTMDKAELMVYSIVFDNLRMDYY